MPDPSGTPGSNTSYKFSMLERRGLKSSTSAKMTVTAASFPLRFFDVLFPLVVVVVET